MKFISIVKQLDDVVLLKPRENKDIEDGEYIVSLEKIGKKRTNKQNAFLWILINAIAKKLNSTPTIKNINEIYCSLLEKSGAKYEIIYVSHDTLMSLIENEIIKNVKVIKQEVVKHKVYDVAKVFYGSSKMDIFEMTHLLNTTLKYAQELGIETETWREFINE